MHASVGEGIEVDTPVMGLCDGPNDGEAEAVAPLLVISSTTATLADSVRLIWCWRGRPPERKAAPRQPHPLCRN